MEVTKSSAIKGLLRREVRALMEDMTNQEKDLSDGALIAQFTQLPQLQKAETVLLFYGVGQEPGTAGLIERLLGEGKRVCLPRCLKDGIMEARQIRSLEELSPGALHIPEPGEAAPLVPREEIDLILAPALCCDLEGYRLGQGGGYYDRYLDGYQGVTVSLCREEFLQSMLPREAHDKPVTLVLTEEGIPSLEDENR